MEKARTTKKISDLTERFIADKTLMGVSPKTVETYRNKFHGFEIERVGDESKFFGYGVFQKINVHIIDRFR